MNRHFNILVSIIVAAFICSLTSCVSPKKVILLQGSDSIFASPQKIMQDYQLRIKAADRLTIKVHCQDKELLEPFTNEITLGGTASGAQGGLAEGQGGFTVSPEGDIIVPLLGKISVLGMTREECARKLEQLIKDKGYINDATVKVDFQDAHITVLGAISGGVISLSSERTSILDVLGQCGGDVTVGAHRQNIRLYREVNGERIMYRFDITDAKLFNSPCYYVQQNDIIYVEPSSTVLIDNSPFAKWWSLVGTGLGVVSTIVAVIALVK